MEKYWSFNDFFLNVSSHLILNVRGAGCIQKSFIFLILFQCPGTIHRSNMYQLFLG